MSTSKKPSLSLHLDSHLKEELTDYIPLCFESYQRIPYSQTGRVDKRGMVNTLLMIKACVRYFFIKVLFFHQMIALQKL